MAARNLEELPILDGYEVNVVETSKGQRFKYDSEHGLFRCEKTLPLGEAIPFDFGFLPSTIAEDPSMRCY